MQYFWGYRTDKDREVYIAPLSQLNKTVYHVEKNTAEEEILRFISFNKS
ncbi:MAG: Unknown protein [uncultured Sulfurovum sp.]|uniref:Uncharacterized protein n=1 Tax=uncultured Sulfurovum sp. TaxID=269237 RepID=A0A6S6SF43_9BACT|nr:MAG: Unknown protein [uncultured Sulfurovum sp.]